MFKFSLQPPVPLQADSSSASTIEELLDWRVRDRIRTVAAGLVLCLHLGVDPPDIWKPSPCARWECWIDPVNGNPVRKVGIENVDDSENSHLTLHLKSTSNHVSGSGTSLERTREGIGRNLLLQYENWQPRVRYKTLLDPTTEELRKLCSSLRKSAKQERVLLHYNGHGVPKPTRNGELWVFNKQFTQYIPVSIADIVNWIGLPSVWILDCPAAAFLQHALQRLITNLPAESSFYPESANNTSILNGNESFVTVGTNGTENSNSSEVVSCENEGSNSAIVAAAAASKPLKLIVFSACDSNETLPFTPALPADILTSCLTTPLDMAIRWHCHINGPLFPQTLSIDAALQIPGKLSDRRTPLGELNWIFTAVTDTIAWLVLPRDLFRRLYRQDLLIASLSRNYLLAQRILKSLYCSASSLPELPPTHQHSLWTLWDHALDTLLAQLSTESSSNSEDEGSSHKLRQSTFFPDQLDAFELWLGQHRNAPPKQIIGPPDQLPAALQVLLSQNLRPRALSLFAQFCNFGPWACLECLHVGIHPYILKLIVSNAPTAPSDSITQSLLQIWTRMMVVDASCKLDLLKDSAFSYFIAAFQSEPVLAAQAIIGFCIENPAGFEALQTRETFSEIMKINLEALQRFSSSAEESKANETLWRLLLLSRFPKDYGNNFLRSKKYLTSDYPEIRAASVLALNLDCNDLSAFRQILSDLAGDASPMVRLEVFLMLLGSSRYEEFSDLIDGFKEDPFEPISALFHLASVDTSIRSNFAENRLNEACFTSAEAAYGSALEQGRHQQTSSKNRVLNELEIDSWLERPITARRLDSQLAVLESDAPIQKIVFHPHRADLFVLDSSGIISLWPWEQDPDVSYADLPKITVVNGKRNVSDFLLVCHKGVSEFLVVCSGGPTGIVRIYDTRVLYNFNPFDSVDTEIIDHQPISAFSCQDSNVKLFEMQSDGLILMAGDERVSIYSLESERIVFTKTRTSGFKNGPISAFLEISPELIVLGTALGWVEVIRVAVLEDEESFSCCNVGEGVVHLWHLKDSNGNFVVITSSGRLESFSINHSCDDLNLIQNSIFSQGFEEDSSKIGPVSGFTHHSLLPFLVAYGCSLDHSIKIVDFSTIATLNNPSSSSSSHTNNLLNHPISLQSLKYHDGFLGQRLGPIGMVQWHRSRMVLGTVTSETVLSVFGNKRVM